VLLKIYTKLMIVNLLKLLSLWFSVWGGINIISLFLRTSDNVSDSFLKPLNTGIRLRGNKG
jgi:hypothetical protein